MITVHIPILSSMVSQKSFTKIFLFSFSLRWSHKKY
ncbi:hypothetical protein VARV_LUK_331 [Variola virus]